MARKINATVKVENIKLSSGNILPWAKFKDLGDEVTRVTAPKLAPIFIKHTGKGFEAKVRGDDTTATARTADRCFANAASAFWA